MVQAGQYVTDGTAVFIVTDIRDGAQVGDIKLSPVLRKGYVKANGALLTSARANYPRLITFLTENPSLNAADDTAWNANKALYVYNSSANTLRVPDCTGRVLQGGSAAGMLAAGLPNITGSINSQDGAPGSGVGPFLDGTEAFSVRISSPKRFAASSFTGTYGVVDFSAGKSNSIYGSSTTVQPPALTMISQIKY